MKPGVSVPGGSFEEQESSKHCRVEREFNRTYPLKEELQVFLNIKTAVIFSDAENLSTLNPNENAGR